MLLGIVGGDWDLLRLLKWSVILVSVLDERVTSWFAATGALLPLSTLATFTAGVATDALSLDATLLVRRM